jgi:hypothetical protein
MKDYLCYYGGKANRGRNLIDSRNSLSASAQGFNT